MPPIMRRGRVTTLGHKEEWPAPLRPGRASLTGSGARLLHSGTATDQQMTNGRAQQRPPFVVSFSRMAVHQPGVGRSSPAGRRLPWIPRRMVNTLRSKTVEMLTQTFIMKLCSNWGHPDLISASEMVLLDKRRVPIDVIRTSVLPRDASPGKLSRLAPGAMTGTLDSCWSAPFRAASPIEISVVLDGNAIVQYARFRNERIQGDSAVRCVEVWRQGVLHWRGDASREFWLVAQLGEEDYRGPASGVPGMNRTFLDQYGHAPQVEATCLAVEFLTSYNGGNWFGLSGIEIWDTDHGAIGLDRISDMRADSCATSVALKELFRGGYIAPDGDRMWLVEKRGPLAPVLTITFSSPVALGMLQFWNVYGRGQDTGAGARNVRIRVNDEVVWVGKLGQGTGDMRDIARSVTQVALNDMNEIMTKPVDSL